MDSVEPRPVPDGKSSTMDGNLRGIKVIVLGIDGLSPGLVRTWAQAGYLPNFARLIAEGCLGKLRSTGEFSSPQAWPSFMTGVNPGKHGVFSFLQRTPGTFQCHHTTSRDIKAETIFAILSRHRRTVAALNFPCTYPAQPVNGVVIGGWLTPGLHAAGATYPPELAAQIKSRFGAYPFHTDVKRHVIAGNYEQALVNLLDAVKRKAQVAEHLYGQQSWDLFALAIVETDAVQHYFWPYCDPRHPLYDQVDRSWCQDPVRRLYRQVDAVLGSFMNRVDGQTVLIVMSDHGGAILNEGRAYVRSFLEQAGLLVVKPHGWPGRLHGAACRCLEKIGHQRLSKSAKSRLLANASVRRWVEDYFAKSFIARNDWSRTRVYSLYWETQPWVNVAGREPHGIVQPAKDYERVREYIVRLLSAAKDPATGQPAVEKVFRREELYHGPYLENFPDTAIWWNRNIPLSGLVVQNGQHVVIDAKKELDMTGLYGGHSPDGIVGLWGPGIHKGQTLQGAAIEDLAPTILHLCGVPILEEMDGRPLLRAMTRPLSHTPIRYQEGRYAEVTEDTAGYSQEDNPSMKQRLPDLDHI